MSSGLQSIPFKEPTVVQQKKREELRDKKKGTRLRSFINPNPNVPYERFVETDWGRDDAPSSDDIGSQPVRASRRNVRPSRAMEESQKYVHDRYPMARDVDSGSESESDED